MATALRVDESYVDVRPDAPDAAASYVVRSAKPRKTRPTHRVETGLAPGLDIEVSVPLADGVQASIERLLEIKHLPAGWDSHGAKPVDEALFRPALGLVLYGVKRCQIPRIHANGAGGIDLFWDRAMRSLEISVQPGSCFEVYYSDEATGEEVDSEILNSISAATSLLDRFCAQP